MLSTSSEVFTDFGPSGFLRRARAASLPLVRDARTVRRELRAACPADPGVYGMIDRAGRLVYVGTSVRLRDRLLDYFQSHDARQPLYERGGRKELRVASRAARLVWEVVGHELLALLRELELIRRFQPELNVRGRRKRRLAYLYLSAEDAPRFCVGGELPRRSRRHWGPLAAGGKLLRAAELLNRYFKLADCPDRMPMRFADQGELFGDAARPGCLRGEVDACLGPCAGLCTRRDYGVQLRRATAFLNGRSDEPLATLRRAMIAAAANRQFEQAARVRDVLEEFESLASRLVLLRSPQRHDFIYPVSIGRGNVWILIHRGRVLTVHPVPRSPLSAERWLARLAALRENNPPPLEQQDANEARIVAAWFRQCPDELASVLSFDDAIDRCRAFSRQDPAVR